MTLGVRPFVRFCRWLFGLITRARNPLSVVPLLLFRKVDRRVDFAWGARFSQRALQIW